MLKIKWSSRTAYNLLIALLIFSVWAFNESKIITYPVKIIYIIMMGYYAVSRYRTGTKYQVWCLVMIVMSFIPIVVAPNFSTASYTFINMLQVLMIGFVTYGYLDEKSKIDFVLEMLVCGGLILSFRLILVTPANVWLSWNRLGEAIGSNSNDLGNKAAISAIIAVCMAKYVQGGKKILYFAAFGILTIIVLFSGSRKALIAVVAGVILLSTIGLHNKRKIIFSVVLVGALLFVGYRFIMTNEALYAKIGWRIEDMIDVFFHGGSEAHSIDLRKKYIFEAWQLIKQHPFLGIGLGSFQDVSGYKVYSHCDYTEVACSYGIIGAIVYYLPLLSMTKKYIMLRNKSDRDYMILIIQIVLLMTYLTMVMYTSAFVQVLIALFVAHYKLRTVEKGNKDPALANEVM